MGSLQEELSAALDGAELPSDTSGQGADTTNAATDTTVDTGADTAAVGAASTGRDENGRFTGKQGADAQQDGQQQQAQTPEQQQQATDPAQQAQSLEEKAMVPPTTWSAGAKAMFAQLPDVVRKEIRKREADYSVGVKKYAEKANKYDDFMREAQPYEAMLRAEGSDALGALKSFLHQAYVLRTAPPKQKAELILQVAQQFGADLSPYFGQQGQQQAADGQQDLSSVQQMVQQLVAPHLQKIQQWEMQQTTAQQNHAQQMEREIQSQIEAFQSATNDDGTPKHLYFENVRTAMSALMGNGEAKTLDQAYEMACWANPEVRAALIAERHRTDEATRLAEAKRKAQDAGRAGFNVSGQGGVGIAGSTSTSLRDELAAQLDAATGGGRV